MLRLIFSRSNAPGSLLIRMMTGFSKWSHVAVIDGDMVIQATHPRVERIPLAEAKRGKVWAIKEVPCRDPVAAHRFGLAQVGKPYDYGFLFGFPFDRDWRDEKAWACSELVAAQLEEGNDAPIVMSGTAHRVTPETLWLLPGTVKEKS